MSDPPSPPRRPPLRTLRVALSVLWTAVVLLSVGAVVLIAALWLLIPKLDEYRPDLERGLSRLLGETVTIGAVETYWEGWSPVLRLEDVRLAGPGRNAPGLRFERARITVDPVASVGARALRAQSVRITGASLVLRAGADGGITIAGMARDGTQAPPPLGDAFVKLLLTQRNLQLESATVRWQFPDRKQAPYVLEQINLQLRNAGAGHHLEGSLLPPGRGANPVVFIVDVDGDVTGSAWTATAFVRATGLDLTDLPLAGRFPGVERIAGRASFELRGRFSRAKLQSVTGDLSLDTTTLATKGVTVTLEQASAALRGRREGTGWTLDLDRLAARTERGVWPPTRATVAWRPATESSPGRLTVSVDRTRIRDLRAAVTRYPAGAELRKLLAALAPDAELRALRASIDLSEKRRPGFRLTADVRGFSARAAGRLPGITGLNGRLRLTPAGGRVEIERGAIELRGGRLFRRPVALEPSAGTLSWRRDRARWRVELSDLAADSSGVAMRASGTVIWGPGAASPDLDLRLHAERGSLRVVLGYLPASLVGPKVAAWLERAIESGRLDSADLVVEGPAANFPFKAGGGRFNVRARASDIRLKYGRRWPVAEHVSGELTLDGRKLRVSISGGSMYDTRLEAMEIAIDDVNRRPATLTLRGSFSGPTRDTLRYLDESPLAARFRRALDRIGVEGDSRLELAIELPVGKPATRVEGTLRLQDNTLLGRGLNVRLEHATGNVRFDKRGIEAQGIEARYLGSPVRLALAQLGNRSTRLRLRGDADGRLIARQLRRLELLAPSADPPAALPAVGGHTAWQADVVLANGVDPSLPALRLRIDSRLEGLALDLPPPLGKTAAAIRPLRIEADLSDPRRRTVRLRYGSDLGATLALRAGAGGWSIERGAIRAGDGEARLPEAPGLWVSGRIESLAVDAWVRFLAPRRPATAGAGPDWSAALERVELAVARLEVMGRSLSAREFVMTRETGGGWTVDIDGEAVGGRVRIASRQSGDPVVVELDHLGLTPLAEPRAPATDPRSLPPMVVRIGRLSYDARRLGRASLEVVPERAGVRLRDIRVSSSRLQIRGAGRWTVRDGRHTTELGIVADSAKLSDLLSIFGYRKDATAGGKTRVSADLRWPGPPADFSLQGISGTLQFRSTKGQLLGLRPGLTGRAFGLLSLTALGTRLRLDFKDIFGKGFRFDRIAGSFTLADGDAYTNNVTMDGPSARVEVAGRTGLTAKDYDQTVTVTPKLSSSIPLAPIWLAEKLLGKKRFDQTFASQYTLTGTWSRPVVEPIRITDDDDGFQTEGGL